MENILYKDINIETSEGKLLKAALIMLSNLRNKDERPSEVLNKVIDFENMIHPQQEVKSSIASHFY